MSQIMDYHDPVQSVASMMTVMDSDCISPDLLATIKDVTGVGDQALINIKESLAQVDDDIELSHNMDEAAEIYRDRMLKVIDDYKHNFSKSNFDYDPVDVANIISAVDDDALEYETPEHLADVINQATFIDRDDIIDALCYRKSSENFAFSDKLKGAMSKLKNVKLTKKGKVGLAAAAAGAVIAAKLGIDAAIKKADKENEPILRDRLIALKDELEESKERINNIKSEISDIREAKRESNLNTLKSLEKQQMNLEKELRSEVEHLETLTKKRLDLQKRLDNIKD